MRYNSNMGAILNSEKAAEIISNQQPIDRLAVERVKKALESKGVILAQSEDIDRNLISRGVEAVVLDPGDTIFMHTNVSASGFFEELIHYGQIKSKRFTMNSPIDVTMMEIEAQERLIKYKKSYKIPEYEIAVLTENLRYYKIRLRKLLEGGF